MFGLVDCNNFFVSCERVFAPRLAGRPVVVLSNNDGCVISRSNEAKRLGIKMGEPFFHLRDRVRRGEVDVRSSNYVLYADMSRRVMSVIRRFVPRIEVYSIDECFLDLEGVADPEAFGRRLAATVRQWTGIPVSVGVAPTKTLAKVASKFAKKYEGYHSCCVIDSEAKRIKALQLTPIGDVWGVGRRLHPTLLLHGVKTAYDLTQWSEQRVRGLMALPGLHTWRELHGQPVIALETPAKKKSLTASRSFKQPVTDYEELRSLVADFASHCADRLRREGSAARTVTVYLRTDPFREDLPQYANAATLKLDVATSDLRELAAASARALKTIWRDGYGYKKAGVLLTDIASGGVQAHLFDSVNREKQQRLLEAVDAVRRKNGAEAIRVATQRDATGAMRREHCSPCYTTCLDDVIKVR